MGRSFKIFWFGDKQMTSKIEPGYNHKRVALNEVVPLRSPFVVQITPSTFCPFKCNYCIQSSPSMGKRGLLKWDTFLKVCDQIKEFDDKLKQITIAGWGEPLTNKKLPDMIRHIKESDIANEITLVTNGYLLTEKVSLEIINAGLDNMRISLEGMSADKYKEIAGINLNFDDLVNKIKFFYDNKNKCNVYVKVADISLDKNGEELFYHTFRNISDTMYIESIRPIFWNNDGKSLNKWGLLHSPVDICTPPFFELQIDENGKVIPCCGYYDAPNLGNVHTSTLKEIWNNKILRDFQIMLLKKERKTQNVYPVCRDCIIPNVTILPEDELDPYADILLKKFGVKSD